MFLVLRRLVFMGVALPQISSTGVVIALCVPMWLGILQPEHSEHIEHLLAFGGSIIFSLSAILLLAFLERRGRGLAEGRLGTCYVVASALSILLFSLNKYAEVGWADRMKGQVIAIDNSDMLLTMAALALVLLTLGLFHKEILLVSFDRTLALTLRKNVVFWDVLLYLVIGLTVSMAVLTVGPLTAFGFLLIPALSVHLFARNMREFAIYSSLLGGAAALAGFYLAYKWDWPAGPTDVVLLGLIYAIIWAGYRFRLFLRKRLQLRPMRGNHLT
jgi:ABC-type Mn2+/Zn2+ transport system permease subunit